MSVRSLARSSALVFFAAIGAYLLYAAVEAWLAPRAAAYTAELSSTVVRAVVAVAAVDLSKLVGLAPAAWLLGTWLSARPYVTAVALVLTLFGIETAVLCALGQVRGLWTPSLVPIARAVSAAVLVLVTARIVRRRQSRA